ncbi:MAG: ATP-dependent RecD-like DNA helicase [Desulfobacterales bacterium]|nr:ATP-dependent RecD-like DNA helicase [Desulfobacterales bacterium]
MTQSTLEGRLERITFFNPENHYTIAVLKPHQSQNPVTIVGFMATLRPGETLKITGTWETHPRFGQQFKVSSYATVLPDASEDIRIYLESGIIKGIGPVTARRLVDRFGPDTLDIIAQHPQKLCEVDGIGKATAEIIAKAWNDHHVIDSLMQFLQTVGLKNAFCAKIIKAYGGEAMEIIRANPYRLAHDIGGISFFMADAVAQNLGMAETEPERIQACVRHLIAQSVKDGHMFISQERLQEQSLQLFNVTPDAAAAAVSAMVASQELVLEAAGEDNTAAVFLKTLHLAETGLAARLKALLSVPVPPVGIDAENILHAVQKKLTIKLSTEQLNALEAILSRRAVVITGGPGTGKTTLIRSVNAIFETLSKQVLLTAPTGRAARRLSEITRREAWTIHKALGYNFETGHFDRNPDYPLEADALIVDEASMVDTLLMFHLLRAMPLTAHLVLVGDIFQLPPVGPGNVLADIISSARIPAYYLNQIFRQSQESPIIMNAHRVRQGNPLDLTALTDPAAVSEFCFLEEPHPQKVVDAIVELTTRIIPQRFSLDPFNDIQVLSPMHKGAAGIINLNQVLQKVLNPNPAGIENMGSTFRPGDKVMHLKNNYQKDVFNGDIGVITAMDRKNGLLSVDYDGRSVPYEMSEMDELALAYAISVHKSQGSEYPAVIVPLTTQHFPLLQRNLLYTAMTRGEKVVVLVGSTKALQLALANDKPRRRLSRLADRLRDR